MKRFAVFAGDVWYPEGGRDDHLSDHDTQIEARDAIRVDRASERIHGHGCYWAHIFDNETDSIVIRFAEFQDGYEPTSMTERDALQNRYYGCWYTDESDR